MLSWICFLEHLEVSSAICHHFDETATRVVVLLVLLEVCCKHIDLFGKHCYLHLLGTSVFGVDLVLFDDCLLFLR